MAEEVAALVLRFEATFARFENQLSRLQQKFDRTAKGIEDRAQGMENRLTRVGSEFGNRLVARFGAVAVGLVVLDRAIRGVVGAIADIPKSGDKIKLLEGRFKALTGSAERAGVLVKAAFEIGAETGADFDGITSGLTRFTIAGKELGRTDAEVQRFTESLLKLGKIGGGAAQEVRSGVIQLGQSLAKGRLDGDELRSVMENMPLVAQKIAKGFGVGIGQIKAMGEAGQLVADKVFQSILDQTEEIDAQWKQVPLTMEIATGKLITAWIALANAIDKATGSAQFFANQINLAADEYTILARNIANFPESNAAQAFIDAQLEAKSLKEEIEDIKQKLAGLNENDIKFGGADGLTEDLKDAEDRLIKINLEVDKLRAHLDIVKKGGDVGPLSPLADKTRAYDIAKRDVEALKERLAELTAEQDRFNESAGKFGDEGLTANSTKGKLQDVADAIKHITENLASAAAEALKLQGEMTKSELVAMRLSEVQIPIEGPTGFTNERNPFLQLHPPTARPQIDLRNEQPFKLIDDETKKDAAALIEIFDQLEKSVEDAALAARKARFGDVVSELVNLENALRDVGLTEAETIEPVNRLRQALLGLADAKTEIARQEAFGEITTQIREMTAEAVAISQGEEALRRFREEGERSEFLDEYARRLSVAEDESGDAEDALRGLTEAFDRLRAAAARAVFTDFTKGIDAQVASTQARIEALKASIAAGSRVPIEAFDSQQSIESEIASKLEAVFARERELLSQGVPKLEIIADTAPAISEINKLNNLLQEKGTLEVQLSFAVSGGGRGEVDETQKLIDQFNEQIKSIEILNAVMAETIGVQSALDPITQNYAISVAAAAMQTHLMSEALRAGLQDTPELQGKIADLAQSYSELTDQSQRFNQFVSNIEGIKEATDELEREISVLSGINPLLEDFGAASATAEAEQRLLFSAMRAGIDITDELRALIRKLAEEYGFATGAANELAESQANIKAGAEEFRATAKDTLSGFIDDLEAGTSATEALANALQKISDKLQQIALDSIFDSGGGGKLSGFLSFASSIFGAASGVSGGGGVTTAANNPFQGSSSSLFSGSTGQIALPRAAGGFVRGQGTGTSDSIPTMLSDGEFVTNARATRRFLPVLKAINSGGRGFASSESSGGGDNTFGAGRVSGQGTGTSDDIPAMLSDGEFVINAKATRRFLPLLESINSGDFRGFSTGEFKGFASGGLVGNILPAPPSLSAPKTSSEAVSTAKSQVSGTTINMGGLHLSGVKDADSFRNARPQIMSDIARELQRHQSRGTG